MFINKKLEELLMKKIMICITILVIVYFITGCSSLRVGVHSNISYIPDGEKKVDINLKSIDVTFQGNKITIDPRYNNPNIIDVFPK